MVIIFRYFHWGNELDLYLTEPNYNPLGSGYDRQSANKLSTLQLITHININIHLEYGYVHLTLYGRYIKRLLIRSYTESKRPLHTWIIRTDMAYAFGDQSGSAYDGYEFNTPFIQPSLKSTKKKLNRTKNALFYIYIYSSIN